MISNGYVIAKKDLKILYMMAEVCFFAMLAINATQKK